MEGGDVPKVGEGGGGSVDANHCGIPTGLSFRDRDTRCGENANVGPRCVGVSIATMSLFS
jgi:hypothetical protein